MEVQWRRILPVMECQSESGICPCVPCFCFNIYFYIFGKSLTPELIGKCEDVETKNIYWAEEIVTVWTINQTHSRVTERQVP